YKKADIIGKTTLELNIWNTKEDRERFVHTFKAKGRLDGDMFRVNKQNGHPITAKLYASTITIGNKGYLLVVANDVTQKEQYLKELERKKRELETIIQIAPYPIIIHDRSGKIHMLNHAWSHYSGYKLEDLETVHNAISLMFDIPTQELVRKQIVELYNLTSNNEPIQYRIRTKNAEEAIWQFTTAPLGIVDGKQTVVTSAVDITELTQKDDMLIAQSRHAAMGEMVGMIAHQWRQPLSSISMDANNMLLDIAMDKLQLSKVEEYAQSISNQTQHLSKTIDDFRNFFKPDKLLSTVNIQETLNQTLTIVQDSLKNNDIALNISYESNEKVNVFPRELMQVFVNIINNAKDSLVAHKPKNPIINIRVYTDPKYLNIEICDNGDGIKYDILPKVFDPFFSTKDDKIGTGVGLYMSQIIVQKHLNGKLEAHNCNQGVCFKIRLIKASQEEG
ncbi:MAG: PAS domain-containing sensor histidine kinase, partial [Campylobacterota bacterium]|nr:PAS domain-containing sensor histidine kinase [Campylobacterota bacterium]